MSVKGTISQSFATGSVTGWNGQGFAGGLVAELGNASVDQSYATGAVRAAAEGGYAAGLVSSAVEGSIRQSFATGRVTGASGFTGGLVAVSTGKPAIESSYWDTGATGQNGTAGGIPAGGKPMTTKQLQSGLPTGFDGSVWSLFPQHNLRSTTNPYPYPTYPVLIFPISQLASTSYTSITGPAYAKEAETCLATVYTMIAHFVGAISRNLQSMRRSMLAQSTVDTFWVAAGAEHTLLDDDADITKFPPNRVLLYNYKLVYEADKSTIIDLLTTQRLDTVSSSLPAGPVMIGGMISASGGGIEPHWMLGIGATTAGGITFVIADDPLTGTKVEINSQNWQIANIMDPVTGNWVSMT